MELSAMQDAALIRLSVERLRRQKEQVEAMKDTLLARDADLLQVSADFEALSASKQTLEDERVSLAHELKRRETELDEVRQDLTLAHRKIMVAEEASSGREKKWTEVEDLMRSTVRRLRAQLQAATADARRKDDAVQAVTRELRELRAERQSSADSRLRLERQAQESDERRRQADAALVVAERAKADAEQREARVAARLEERDRQLGAVRNALQKEKSKAHEETVKLKDLEGRYQEAFRVGRVFKEKLQGTVDKKGKLSRKNQELQAANAQLLAENASLTAITDQLRQQLRGLNEELEKERVNRKEWAAARSQLLRQFCETDNQIKSLIPPGRTSFPESFKYVVGTPDYHTNEPGGENETERSNCKQEKVKTKPKPTGSAKNGRTRSRPTYAEPIGQPRGNRGRIRQGKAGAKAVSALASLNRRREREQRHRCVEKRRLRLRSRSSSGVPGRAKQGQRREKARHTSLNSEPRENGSPSAFDDEDDVWGDALAEPELLTDFDAMSSIGASVS